jgi:uncharacterized membrane protein
MKTELIFFDSLESSKQGTLRGLIAIITLISLDLIWFQIAKLLKIYTDVHTKKMNYISAFLSWLLICSAISVQLPKTLTEAMTYGMLVGLVVYGVWNLTNHAIMKWPIKTIIADILWGMFVCSMASLSVFLIYHKPKLS